MERTNETFVLIAQLQILKLLAEGSEHKSLKDIGSDSFSSPKFKALYLAIHILKKAEETITPASLLREANQIDSNVDMSTVQTLFQQKVDDSNVLGALNSLKDSMAKYKISKILDTLREQMDSQESLNTVRVSSLNYSIQEIIGTTYNQSTSKDFTSLLTSYEAELVERRKGLRFNFNDRFLDTHMAKKAAPGQIITIAGATGTGKSIYGLHLMSGLVNTDVPCMYVSPEMDEISTMDRWMAMRNEIPIEEWNQVGHGMDALIKLVQKEREALKDKAFRFIDKPDISLDTIQHFIREFKITYGVDYLVVFIDLITQVKEFIDTRGKGNTSLPTLIEQGVNKLNEIAKGENVCIVAIAQMNREADSAKVEIQEDLQKLRPTRNNIKNSAAIAERSRTVLGLFREKYYADQHFPNSPEVTNFIDDVLEVQILKQNMGRVGEIGTYNFNGPTFTLNEFIAERVPEQQGED